ncbi:hypothetical protein C8R45DRAFT_947918 [Mycena sanguinolenta]|nr:hypothetical protein C8R45DRAFT_947918 [Mycena sanguinolenta]
MDGAERLAGESKSMVWSMCTRKDIPRHACTFGTIVKMRNEKKSGGSEGRYLCEAERSKMNCGRTGDTKNWTGDMKNAERAGDTTMNEQRKGTRTRNKMAPVTRAAEGARSLARLWLREPRDCCAVVEISSGDAVAVWRNVCCPPERCYTGRRRLPIEGGSNATPLESLSVWWGLPRLCAGSKVTDDLNASLNNPKFERSPPVPHQTPGNLRGVLADESRGIRHGCIDILVSIFSSTLNRLFNYTFRGPIGQGGNNKPSGWHTILCGGSVPFWKSGAGVRKSRSKERRRKHGGEVEPTDRQTGTRWTEREVKGRDDAAAWVGVGWIGWNEKWKEDVDEDGANGNWSRGVNLGDDGGETTARKALIGQGPHLNRAEKGTQEGADAGLELRVASCVKWVIGFDQGNVGRLARESRSSEAQRGVRTESTRQPKYPESASTAESREERGYRSSIVEPGVTRGSVGIARSTEGDEGERAGRDAGGEWNGEKRGKWKAEEARPTREVVEGGVMGRGGGEKERGSARGGGYGLDPGQTRHVSVHKRQEDKRKGREMQEIRRRAKKGATKREYKGSRMEKTDAHIRSLSSDGLDVVLSNECRYDLTRPNGGQRMYAKETTRSFERWAPVGVARRGDGGDLRRDENGDWDGAGAARGDQGGIPPEGARALFAKSMTVVKKKKKKEKQFKCVGLFCSFLARFWGDLAESMGVRKLRIRAF